jgi:hypothetical protein
MAFVADPNSRRGLGYSSIGNVRPHAFRSRPSSLADDEGEVRAGDYVWRPKGNRHIAHAPQGALVLSFFLSPNRFLDDGSEI